MPNKYSQIGNEVIPGVGEVVGSVIDILGNIFDNKGEHPTQSDIDISNGIRPLLAQWIAFELKLHPEDTTGLNQWKNNFEGSLGSSNALHQFLNLQAGMCNNKYYNPPMPLEWYKDWNSLIVASGTGSTNQLNIPPGTVYSDSYVGDVIKNTKVPTGTGSGKVPSSTNNILASLGSGNTIMIIVLIGGLSYLFFKAK